MVAPLRWTGGALEILDQTLLPHVERVVALRTTDEVTEAIRRLAVRGAPLIGVAAGYGVVLARGDAEAIARLRAARPTAVNLAWAVDRVAAAADPEAEAIAIEQEDAAASRALGRHGADALEAALPDGPLRLMTHCNAGALAASGRGIPHELIVDGAAAGLIRCGEVDAVVTGFDRVAANGDGRSDRHRGARGGRGAARLGPGGHAGAQPGLRRHPGRARVGPGHRGRDSSRPRRQRRCSMMRLESAIASPSMSRTGSLA